MMNLDLERNIEKEISNTRKIIEKRELEHNWKKETIYLEESVSERLFQLEKYTDYSRSVIVNHLLQMSLNIIDMKKEDEYFEIDIA